MTTDATTNFEVMEDALGFELSFSNKDRIDSLAVDDIRRLAKAIRVHTHSEYFRVPEFPTEIVGTPDVQSSFGQILGGFTNSTEHYVGRTAHELVGGVYHALMSQDRLMLPDGLQYALDYYWLGPVSPQVHARLGPEVVKILTAYASLRPLFVSRHVLILPMDCWPIPTVNARLAEDLETTLLTSPALAAKAAQVKLSPAHLASIDQRFPGESESERGRRSLARMIAIVYEPRLWRLLTVARSYGLAPILDGPYMQIAFDAYCKTPVRQLQEPAVLTVEENVLLPFLGRLSVDEFAAVKASGDLQPMCRRLRSINADVEAYRDRPVELRARLKDELRDAAAEIGGIVNGSAVLRSAVSAIKGACIGAIVVPSVVIAAGYPTDPLKALLSSSAGAAAGLVKSVTDDVGRAVNKRAARRVYLKLADAVEAA